MGAVTIAFALIAMFVTGAAYYVVIPYYYNIKLNFDANPYAIADADAIAFGDTIYNIIGIFPLLFFGAIALNGWLQTIREHGQGEAGFE